MENERKRRKITVPVEVKLLSDAAILLRNKDFHNAMSLYDSAITENLKLDINHFTFFLDACSNFSQDLGRVAIERGLNIYNDLMSKNISPNEATITTMCRLSATECECSSLELVKILAQYNVKPKLRTYSPTLFCFVDQMNEKDAYLVEKEILEMGLSLEEPEIAALLKASAKSWNKDKVYEYLRKLRMCVPSVSESTTKIIETWFHGEIAAEVGTDLVDWDKVNDVILRNGGGWHGIGWIGNMKWMVQRTNVDSDGCFCKDQLACLEIGTEEREACSVHHGFHE